LLEKNTNGVFLKQAAYKKQVPLFVPPKKRREGLGRVAQPRTRLKRMGKARGRLKIGVRDFIVEQNKKCPW